MKSVRKYFKNPKMTVENMKSVSPSWCVAPALFWGRSGLVSISRSRVVLDRGVTVASPRTHLAVETPSMRAHTNPDRFRAVRRPAIDAPRRRRGRDPHTPPRAVDATVNTATRRA